AQTLRQRAHLYGVEHGARGFERADIERDHAAETLLLPFGEFVLFVRSRTRIINLLHLGMILEKCGDRAPGFIMLLHSQRECLRAAPNQPRIERRETRRRAVRDARSL